VKCLRAKHLRREHRASRCYRGVAGTMTRTRLAGQALALVAARETVLSAVRQASWLIFRRPLALTTGVPMDIVPIPQLSDNYAYLLIDPASREAGVVDCAEADAVLVEVKRRGVALRAVLGTHHHFDHVGGNRDLLASIPDLRVYGSAADAPKIPGITNRVQDGDAVELSGLHGRVIFIPAHTSGHVAYHFPDE